MITDEEFLDWYDGQEGFGLRSERAVEELEPSNMLKLRQWMFAAFEAGRASRNILFIIGGLLWEFGKVHRSMEMDFIMRGCE
jgi:hypothetical protein